MVRLYVIPHEMGSHWGVLKERSTRSDLFLKDVCNNLLGVYVSIWHKSQISMT